jgi:Ca2+-transporting ATPase
LVANLPAARDNARFKMPEMIERPWRLPVDQCLKEAQTDPSTGLSSTQVQKRSLEYGPNELIDRSVKGLWQILWEQMTAIMVVVLIVAAVVSALLGEYKDTAAICAIIVLNAVIGVSQEYRAEKAMAALKRMVVPVVKVRRDGAVCEVCARQLVPGDIVLLEAGSAVPADGRVIEAANLRVQESALTGESEPVDKGVDPIEQEDPPISDRTNMLFMGTAVTYGRATMLVTATGMRTELGRIAELIQTVRMEPTPLQRRLEQLARGLAIGVMVVVGVVFVLGVLRGESVQLMFLTAIGMAVAAVPEGLPAVATIALALGSQRMLRRNALIRKLPAVETLGSVTTICSDKTGTLTENRMAVTILDVHGHAEHIDGVLRHGIPILDPQTMPARPPYLKSMTILLKAAALCNDSQLQRHGQQYRAIGDPTEAALVIAAARFGIIKTELDQQWPRVAEASFTSERKRMTTVHRAGPQAREDGPFANASYIAFCKGAVDGLLPVCTRVWTGHQAVPLDQELLARIMASNDKLASEGQRVLGVAFRIMDCLPAQATDQALEQEMIFVGLIGMIDPPRPEVRQAVSTFKTAGIRPVMITGDHPLTAQYIARELGMASDGKVLTGRQLEQMDVEQLGQVVEDVAVYARVSPEHKLKIVEALQRKGHVVAMTGDGVNDAPALRKADIGVAMGLVGTDVAKEAADMVLLDDNFATIVAAVEEGRVIYDNIRKFIKYTMTSNSAEIWVMLLAPFLGMPLPLLPLQILWVNLVTDGLPGLAFAVEPAERDTMNRPPFRMNESIFARGMGLHIVWVGLVMGLVSLLMGYWAWRTGHTDWRTMVFTTLTLAQMGQALAIRSGRDSIFTIGFLSNKALLGSVILTFLLQMAVVYVPFLQGIFKTVSMSGKDLTISLLLSTVVFWVVEIEKYVRRRVARTKKIV